MTDIAVVVRAAIALAHAARWDDAFALLDATPTGDARVPLAAVEVALEADWFTGSAHTTGRLAAVDRAALDPGQTWDLRFAELRDDYRHVLTAVRAGRPPARDLLPVAERLRADAPDPRRGGWAAFYAGVIADNILGGGGRECFEHALTAAGDDGLLLREALRHLGGHDHDLGEHDLALNSWRRATEAGAAAGAVAGTLSQQLLLAVLARATGDEAGARAVAAEVARWSAAIGATRIAAQAEAFLDGVDPTVPPKTAPTAAVPAQ